MKNFKIMFSFTLIMSTLIAISSYSWIGMWIGLEINLLSMIPIMNDKNLISKESSIKYFISQTMASSILMMTIIILMMNTGMSTMTEKSMILIMMNSSLLTKMGMAPFHFWFPEIMEGLSWMNCLIMMTWQKLAPMILVMYNMVSPLFMTMIILSGMIISGISSFNQISMRKILTYSSINHMSWMLSSMMIMQTIWLYYLIIYSIISMNMIWFLNKMKINLITQINFMLNNKPQMKLIFMFNFLNLGGLPPFLGFLPKWMTIEILVKNNFYMISILMVIFTLIMMFIYLKISISSFLLNSNQKNWNFNSTKIKTFSFSMINFLSLSLLMIMTLMFNIT